MSFADRIRAGAALRELQQRSRAGDYAAAERLAAQAERLDPQLPQLQLQAALAAARADKVGRALELLDQAPAQADLPVYRLFRGWLLARAGRLKAALSILSEVTAQHPDNLVAATALAYALFRDSRPDEALALLAEGAGDNFEVLSWTWLELERHALAQPLAPEPTLPEVAPALSPRIARRLYRAAVAVLEQHGQALCRRRWRQRLASDIPPWYAPLVRPLVEALERRWPTEPLPALLAAQASCPELPELKLNLGAQLYEEGHYTRALTTLDGAMEDMQDSPELWLPGVYRAATLVELRRWDEAAAALNAMAQGDDQDIVHEFAAPHWLLRRARVRLAQGQDAGARADLEAALAGEPALFEERFAEVLGRHGNHRAI